MPTKKTPKSKDLMPQIAERQAYNKMQRGKKISLHESRAAANFVAKGKPKPKYK